MPYAKSILCVTSRIDILSLDMSGFSLVLESRSLTNVKSNDKTKSSAKNIYQNVSPLGKSLDVNDISIYDLLQIKKIELIFFYFVYVFGK